MKSSKRRHLLQTAVLMTAWVSARERAVAQALRTPFAVAPPCASIDGATDLQLY